MMTDPTKFTDVIYEVRDRAAWIIINRPKVYNAFRGQTLEELIQAFNENSSKQIDQRCALRGLDLYCFTLFEFVPRIAQEVVDIRDRDFHRHYSSNLLISEVTFV